MLAAIAWLVCLVVGLGVVAFVNFFGDSMCPSRLRDSDDGKLSWSVLPPGHRCVWTKAMNGYDATEGPGWEASAYLVLMVVSGVAIVRVFRPAAAAAGRPTAKMRPSGSPAAL